MPFIFHSKKQSIFDKKVQSPTQTESKMIESLTSQRNQSPKYNRTLLCKDHPFRKLNKQKQPIVSLVSQSQKNWNQPTTKISQDFKKPIFKPDRSDTNQTEDKSQSDLLVDNKPNLGLFPGIGSQGSKIHEQKDKELENKIKRQQVLKHIRQHSNLNQDRLKYFLDQNPGPGSYNVPIARNQKSTVLYSNQTHNHALPSKSKNVLECSLVSKQTKSPQREDTSFLFDCHYKNQTSPSFRSSILQKPNMRKNGALLSMLFSKKSSDNKENQSQTTCQSRMAQTSKTLNGDDEFIKQEQNSPNPFSYNPNLDFSASKKDKRSKPFFSGEAKTSSYINKKITPGPGFYSQDISQNGGSFSQNQIKRPNKFQRYEDVPQNPVGFSSAVPRQLHYDTQNLCRQELYYSPKNNLTDITEVKYNQGSRSNQFYFGSSLQRFEKDKILEDDPYKYCFSKNKLSQNQVNCPSINFTSKRQLFNTIPNSVSPNKYHDNTKTISKQTEKQIFRKLLQSKYQDEIALLKEKKRTMENVLIQQKNKSIDIKTSQKPSQQLNPDKYTNFMAKKKRLQKESIAFGYNKASPLKRAFEPRKQLDHYYDTEPAWDINSFNKNYGYEVQEN